MWTYESAEWRHDYLNVGLGAGNLLLLALGLQLQSRLGWQITLSLVGITSFWAWYANLKRYRTIADTPTSRIASAPQGYVELSGHGRQPPGERLISPVRGLPCLWYRYTIERKQGDRWEHLESGVSHDTFGLDDRSGLTLVDPEGAEILTSHKQVSTQGDTRRTEWTLIEGEPLYVIGEHVTLGGPNAVLDPRADAGALLTQWKKDQTTLLARFDRDGNGEISREEWEQARAAAVAEVDRMHLEIRLGDGVHLVRKPGDGRPFLIANRDVADVASHFRRWSVWHLALVVGAIVGMGALGTA